MEAEGKNFLDIAKEISKEFPGFPFRKLMRYVEKSNGDAIKVRETVAQKEQKFSEGMKLSQEQVDMVRDEFPHLAVTTVVKVVKRCHDVELVRAKLAQMSQRGRRGATEESWVERKQRKEKERKREEEGNKEEQLEEKKEIEEGEEKVTQGDGRRRKRRHEPKHKSLRQFNQKEVGVIFSEFQKLFPTLESSLIKQEIKRTWKRLNKSCQVEVQQLPEDYEQQVRQIQQITEAKRRNVQKVYKELGYNTDGTIQYLSNNVPIIVKDIQPHIVSIRVDGNNLLYASKVIKNITLKMGKTAGSRALATLIGECNKSLKREIHLVFDDQKDLPKVENLVVYAARPHHPSTDECFVEIASTLPQQSLSSFLFVTSDKELINRLQTIGCKSLMRSKVFIELCEQRIPNLEELMKYLKG